MPMIRSASVLLAASALVMAASAGTAAAADDAVTVFETELQPLTSYENPRGCYKLPLAAHVLVNDTDEPVRIHADPLCMGPSITVSPGHGAHVAPGSGSFSV